MKSANQRYKEYKANGGDMSFKNWVQQENELQFLNLTGGSFVASSDSLQNAITNLHKDAGLKTELEHKYIFGIDRRYIMAGSIVLVLLGGFLIYKNAKK